MAQPIRRSQFITTYGPGAILEGRDGPRVVSSLDNSGLFAQARPSQFEITDRRLSETLLNGARILRLPSNADLGRLESESIYETNSFPSWSLCIRHRILYRWQHPHTQACPSCPAHARWHDAWAQSRREAIRFVRACEAGHLDDVDWPGLMAHSVPSCRPSHLLWQGGGGALRHVDIRCPNCSASINLGVAYSRDWPCSGRHPESGSARQGCAQPSKIIQRGAANLRLSELVSALTIPPRATRLHRLFEMAQVAAAIATLPTRSASDIRAALGRMAANRLLQQPILDEINAHDDDAIERVAEDTMAQALPATLRVLRNQEFSALREAATNGAPPAPAQTPRSPHQFEVVRREVRLINLASGRRLRVTPINRLRVVMVQTGYRRISPTGTLVDVSMNDGMERWLPGVELFGEGIFVDFASESPALVPQGVSASLWSNLWASSGSIDPSDRDRLHPVFVWWHTLAHRLINALSIDSGYSSAAIRERVFVDVDDQSGSAHGGVLLYTVQPGGDGTLGGLVGLVPQFERVLNVAFRDIDACSNDPLCGEERMAPNRVNGAACYSCALVSETSCEFRNFGLDRLVLSSNLP